MVEYHLYAWYISGAFTFWACILSFFLMYKHWRNYTHPDLQVTTFFDQQILTVTQRYIVRIILMVPIYAIDSFLSLLFKDEAILFNTLRDCYEAYVLYIFFRYLVVFLENQGKLE